MAVPTIPPEQRLIYALDGMSEGEAIAQVRTLSGVVKRFKIGPGLVYRGGLEVANRLMHAAGEADVRIFLDMKTWDIPETVFNALEAVDAVAPESVVFATIHTQSANLERLAESKGRRNLKLFAITLLTSLDASELQGFGPNVDVQSYVLQMSERAIALGCDGVVCSGHEVAAVKARISAGALVITPGIRPAWGGVAGDDQKRVTTPRDAILAGADYLVVGRPIRTAPDPAEAAARIQAEISAALGELGTG